MDNLPLDSSTRVPPRIVLSNFGSSGDINPLIAVASALKARGYAPLLAASARYRVKAELEQIGFAAIGPDVSGSRALSVAAQASESEGTAEDRFASLVRTMVAPYIEQSFTHAMEVVAGAALVIVGPLGCGVRVAAIKRGVPWLSLALQPWMLRRSTWHNAARYLAPEQELRNRLGIAGQGGQVWDGIFSPQRTIALYSSLLHTDNGDGLPPRTEPVGFAFYDRALSGQNELSAPLKSFLETGPPPLVFTAGTWLAFRAREFFEHSVRVARALKRRAVLITGVDADGTLLGNDVLACGYAPYSLLFRHVEAIIHHGGIGTASQALSAGRPQLVVPFGFDQHDNAERLVRLGVARRLPARDYTARRAVEELMRLLSVESYREHAADVARCIREEDGAGNVARIVDEELSAGDAVPRQSRGEPRW